MADDSIGEHVLLWRIENFSVCSTKPFSLISPTIRAKDLDDTHWNIVFSPKRYFNDTNISLYLKRSSNDHGPRNLTIELEFCLIDSFCREKFTKRFVGWNYTNDCNIGTDNFVMLSSILEDKDNMLPCDTLTLKCRISKRRNRFGATKSVIRTTILVERSTFLWTIRGLTRKASATIHIESTTLLKGLELACEYGNSNEGQRTPEGEHALRLAIKTKEVPDSRIFMSATIQTLDRHRNPQNEMEAEHFFEEDSNDTWHLPSFDISDSMEGLRKEDRLDLACEFAISAGVDDSHVEETLILPADESHAESNTLQVQIRSVYESSIGADILVKTQEGSESFDAHKMILSARSRVFRSILYNFDSQRWHWNNRSHTSNLPSDFTRPSERSNYEGSVTVSVDLGVPSLLIWHLHTRIVKQMLKCMYTDILEPDSMSNAAELYAAGVRFEFKLLQEKSLSYLKSHINMNEIFSTLTFAHKKGLFQLKSDCIDFISKNRQYLLAADMWSEFRKRYEGLSNQVLDILQSENS